MTVYKYTGRTSKGETKSGKITANSRNAAITKLREKGINPREINESTSILHKDIDMGVTIKNQDFVIYCRQFATLIRAGISIVEATKILAEQTTSKPLKKALEEIEEDIRTGISFSKAVDKHRKIFPEIFINMVRTGEVTGNIDETLDRLANVLEKQYNLKKKIQSTLTYPIFLTVMIIVVVTFLLLVIVPTFVESFEDMGAELPVITIWTLAFSAWLEKYLLYIILFFVVSSAIFFYLFRHNKQFNYAVFYGLLKMPLFGPLFQKTAIARLTRALSSLFSAGVPILQALTVSERVGGNPVIGKIVIEARDNLERGGMLTEPLERSWIFPSLVTSMTKIGETTGSLDFMLEKIADFYETEVDRAVDTLKSLIEPVMILILAVAVGVIVAAIFMPMFSLYEQM